VKITTARILEKKFTFHEGSFMLTRFEGIGVFALCVAAVVTVGCGGGNKAKLRVMNAIPDQSAANVLLDGSSVSSSLSYGNATDYMSTAEGSRHFQIEPSGSTNVIIDQTLTLNSSTNTTVIGADFSATSTGVVLADDITAPSSGNIKLRLVNASPNLGTVDIYVVAPGTSLNSVSPTISSLDFKSASDYQSLAAGSYEIFFTPHGSTFAFLDTGAISLTAGQNRTIVAINNLSGGFKIVTLNDLN
jgi:hypothetical protein